MSRFLRLGLILVALAAACGDRVPAAAGSTATVERDGVRLRLDLERGEIVPGDVLWATLTIQNTTDHDVKWTTGGCREVGQVEAQPKLPDAGRHWPGALGTFKEWALRHPESYARFFDEVTWGILAQGGQGRACPAVVLTETLPAGQSLVSRWAWDGTVDFAYAGRRPAPGGEIEVAGTFYVKEPPTGVVRVTSRIKVRGTPDPYIPPGIAIDRAFDDGRLARWLEARPAPGNNGGVSAGDAAGGVRLDGDTWIVSAAQKVITPSFRSDEIEVRVNARDGTVLSVIQR